MTSSADLLKKAEQTIELALQKGAEAAHASCGASQSMRVGLENNDYNLSCSADHTSVGVVVHHKQKKGSASTNDLSDDSLVDCVDRAISLAAHAVPDEHLALSQPGDIKELEVFDPAVAAMTAEDLMDLGQSFFEKVIKDQDISIDSGGLESSSGQGAIANSNGVRLIEEESSITGFLMALGRRGESVTSFDWVDFCKRELSGFKEEGQDKVSEFMEHIRGLFDPKPGHTYKGMVVLRPEVVSELLLSAISFHAHGDQIKDNNSRWSDMLDQKVASDLLTLHDDVWNTEYLGCCAFDSAGTPVKPRTLVEKGVLKFHMDSIDSASRRGLTPTGHETGWHVPRIEGGQGHVLDLAKQSGQPTLVVRRFSGNVDPITGDFSGVAKNSHCYIDGELIPITETMIAGNLFDLLNNIVVIGESVNHGRSLETGPVLVDGVSVTANSG